MWWLIILVGLDPPSIRKQSNSLFEGEKGAHGGDLGLPTGDGGGQGGQAPAGQVQGEQQQQHGGVRGGRVEQ